MINLDVMEKSIAQLFKVEIWKVLNRL
jgi:hypothetical protein